MDWLIPFCMISGDISFSLFSLAMFCVIIASRRSLLKADMTFWFLAISTQSTKKCLPIIDIELVIIPAMRSVRRGYAPPNPMAGFMTRDIPFPRADLISGLRMIKKVNMIMNIMMNLERPPEAGRFSVSSTIISEKE
jgi:hypothetical protein